MLCSKAQAIRAQIERSGLDKLEGGGDGREDGHRQNGEESELHFEGSTRREFLAARYDGRINSGEYLQICLSHICQTAIKEGHSVMGS